MPGTETRSINCNLCGAKEHKLLYPKNGNQAAETKKTYTITGDISSYHHDIVRCLNCGFVYAVAESSIINEYTDMQDETYLKEERGRRQTAKKILSEIAKLKRPGRLLEIGCALGFLLDEAKKAGWDVSGVEQSTWAAAYAQRNFGIEVINKRFEDATFAEGYFDAVVIIDVIEHLKDPKASLRKIRRLLKDDGIFYVATPDIESSASRLLRQRWWGIKRHHLYYFSQQTLKLLLQDSGFEIIEAAFYVRHFSVDYLTELFGSYNKSMSDFLKTVAENIHLKDRVLALNIHDQIAVYARKRRVWDDIRDDMKILGDIPRILKTSIVLPAYNASRTLRRTIADIPDGVADEIILVDDNSRDDTVAIAEALGLKVFVHKKNLGYGANQKTCYEEALKAGADIVIMLHPDYQYDPKVIPELIEPIKQGEADAVFGSRMMKGGALEGGMPKWKHNANILLTAVENVVLGTYLTEYHSGFRAYTRRLLESVNFKLNSNGFIFDTEIIIQALLKGFKIDEIPIRTRYFDEASTVGFFQGCLYGLGILKTLFKYVLHVKDIIRFKQFE